MVFQEEWEILYFKNLLSFSLLFVSSPTKNTEALKGSSVEILCSECENTDRSRGGGCYTSFLPTPLRKCTSELQERTKSGFE